MTAYGDHFEDFTRTEINLLWQTANWVNIFMKFVPATKYKGLYLEVIPKVVEGWSAKYITGSGQSAPTQARVFIYETEGGVQPFRRMKGRKRLVPQKSVGEHEAMHQFTSAPEISTKKRKRSVSILSADNTMPSIGIRDRRFIVSQFILKSSY